MKEVFAVIRTDEHGTEIVHMYDSLKKANMYLDTMINVNEISTSTKYLKMSCDTSTYDGGRTANIILKNNSNNGDWNEHHITYEVKRCEVL